MKYMITGGCGFLGSNLASEVLKRQQELMVFDNLSRHGSTQNLEWLRSLGRFQFQPGDIRNGSDITYAIRRFEPDVIFHLAGQVAMTTSIERPELDFETNALGSVRLLEAVRNQVPEAVVLYSSTNKVYGDLEQYAYHETTKRYICPEKPAGFDESTALNFHSPYGCSKGAADQYMLDYARIFGLKTVVFRHSSMYGGRQFSTYDQGWVGWFCQQALKAKEGQLQEPFTISGNGKQVRDVLHAEDMKRLYFAAVAHIHQAQGQAFNIGGGTANSLSLLELFELLEDLLDVKLQFRQLPPRESDQKVFVADITKAQTVLEWTPQVNPRHGIQDILTWLPTSVDNARSVLL